MKMRSIIARVRFRNESVPTPPRGRGARSGRRRLRRTRHSRSRSLRRRAASPRAQRPQTMHALFPPDSSRSRSCRQPARPRAPPRVPVPRLHDRDHQVAHRGRGLRRDRGGRASRAPGGAPRRRSRRIARTTSGRGVVPPFAIVAATSAIRSGVTSRSACPKPELREDRRRDARGLRQPVRRGRKLEAERFAELPALRVGEPAVDAQAQRDLREIDVARERERAREPLRAGRFAFVVVNDERADRQMPRIVKDLVGIDDARVERARRREDLERRTRRIEPVDAAIEQAALRIDAQRRKIAIDRRRDRSSGRSPSRGRRRFADR